MMQNIVEEIGKDVDNIPISAVRPLEVQLKEYLDKCGLFYKVFARVKGSKSIGEKFNDRARRGIKDYKMQDLIGIRIVLYFKSDINLCEKIINQHFQVVGVSKDEEQTDKFCPQRINYVCTLPDSVIDAIDAKVWEYPFDKTFEIQIRTIFSEGWHEIEHDFRYKCENDWKSKEDLSRTLNGIFATLDNCDWTISSLLTQMAYRHYKEGSWIPMLKNTFRMRIMDDEGMDDILNYFDSDKELAKKFFRLEREEFLLWLSDLKIKVPLKLKTVVLLANLYSIKDTYLESITPEFLKDLIP